MAADSSVALQRERRHFSRPCFVDAPAKILIVLHQEHSSPGKLGQMLQAKGFALDIRKPRFGDPLPGDDGRACRRDHLRRADERQRSATISCSRRSDWIGVTLKEGAPFLGVCLGAQMLVKHLGGTVSGHCDGCAEIGFYKLHATEAGRQLSNGPAWSISGTARVSTCRRGRRCSRAATFSRTRPFRSNARRSASSSTASSPTPWPAAGRCAAPSASSSRWRNPGREHMEGWFRYDPPIRTWLWKFLDVWLAQDQPRAGDAAGRLGAGLTRTAAKREVSRRVRALAPREAVPSMLGQGLRQLLGRGRFVRLVATHERGWPTAAAPRFKRLRSRSLRRQAHRRLDAHDVGAAHLRQFGAECRIAAVAVRRPASLPAARRRPAPLEFRQGRSPA